MNLKSQLRQYLRFKAVTAAELSRRTGVSKQVLSMWLGGSHPRKLDQLKRVAEELGTTIDHLCFGTTVESHPIEGSNELGFLESTVGAGQTGWSNGIYEIRWRKINPKESKK